MAVAIDLHYYWVGQVGAGKNKVLVASSTPQVWFIGTRADRFVDASYEVPKRTLPS